MATSVASEPVVVTPPALSGSPNCRHNQRRVLSSSATRAGAKLDRVAYRLSARATISARAEVNRPPPPT